MIEGTVKISRAPVKGLIFLWLLACFLFVVSLGDLPLRDFDEATVARVAFEFLDKTGLDYLLPTIWGQPYFNKPPGLHWLISIAMKLDLNLWFGRLPSEFSIRILPAFLSTFVVPLGGLIQWKLRPEDRLSSLATSGILLTLLPISRHGRLAMLDGSQLSAIALLWFLLISLDNTKFDIYRYFFSGLVCSFMLLLKAPLIIPAIFATLPSLIWEKRIRIKAYFTTWIWFVIGLMPGLLWHIWNAYSRGLRATSPWWGDGAGRVLFDSGYGSIGSDLGFWVSLIEVIEGGWPWLIFWPFGIAYAWSQRRTRWGNWALGTQIIMCLSIFPLKMQLPWYSHPLWLPFSIVCGPIIGWLIHKNSGFKIPGEKLLILAPYLLSFLGFSFVFIALFESFGGLLSIGSYSPYLLIIGFSWLFGGKYLLSKSRKTRIIGIFSLFLGSYLSFMLLFSSNLWLWELNENWEVKPVAQMIKPHLRVPIFIEGSFQRPSLNWYASHKIEEKNKYFQSGQIVTNNPSEYFNLKNDRECILIDKYAQWSLIQCES